MKNIIITIVSILAIIGGAVWIGASQPKEQLKTAQEISGVLVAQEQAFDFGTVSMEKGSVTHRYTIKNASDKNVELETISTSCMCTTATLIKGERKIGPFGMPGHGFSPRIRESLAPGEEAAIEAVFDPAAHGPAGVGKIEREIRIEGSSGETLDLQLSALVTP